MLKLKIPFYGLQNKTKLIINAEYNNKNKNKNKSKLKMEYVLKKKLETPTPWVRYFGVHYYL